LLPFENKIWSFFSSWVSYQKSFTGILLQLLQTYRKTGFRYFILKLSEIKIFQSDHVDALSVDPISAAKHRSNQ
jgi:hypothetical protein